MTCFLAMIHFYWVGAGPRKQTPCSSGWRAPPFIANDKKKENYPK